jgi:DNA-binding CsgD family transcriptional regulator
MTYEVELIGREAEFAMLTDVLAGVRSGKGGLVLIAGEAGVGKTRLAEEILADSELLVLRGSIPSEDTPYGPIVGVLRAYLRAAPDGLGAAGPLERYLGLLLPELGSTPERPDKRALVESIRRAFLEIGRRDASVVFLDDLHRADEATLELLNELSGSLENERLLILAAYRTDKIPRGHPLRRLRTELRRANRYREVVLRSLDASHTTELVARILGKTPSRALAAVVYERTDGLPFFVEEFTAALASTRRLRNGGEVVDLGSSEDLPLPETIRDAVIMLTDGISGKGRKALELAATAGTHVDPDVLNGLVAEDDIEELIEAGFLVEAVDRSADFHHDLVREALYREIPWARRRAHHRLLAERLEALGAPPGAIADHWVAAREPLRAQPFLVAAAGSSFALHGYREAARAFHRALEVWPEGEDELGRLAVVERLGECAELSGDLAGAVRAYEEVAQGRRAARDSTALAGVERRLASLYELQADWERTLAARASAAEEFARAGLPGEAASERLAAASHLRSAGDLTAALHLIAAAAPEVDRAGRPDLRALSMALEGDVRAKLGQGREGLELCGEGLSLALAQDLPAVAAQAYFLLADALENAPDYTAALDAYTAAFQFCQAEGLRDAAHVCFACLSPVLLRIGEWDRAVVVCRQVLDESQAPPVARHAAMVELGMIHAMRGERVPARRLLASSLAFGRTSELFPMEIHGLLGLSRLDDLEGKGASAAQRANELVERCWAKEERHYSVQALRWAATFFARRGEQAQAAACAELLSSMAATGGTSETVAALAHALGEIALLEDDGTRAAGHFERALDALSGLPVPHDRAEIQVRAAAALIAIGERERGIEHLVSAYRAARKLKARPLATHAVEELAALGEKVERRLGQRAVGDLERGGLSRRELEVIRLLEPGRTNREIGRELFLSPRTVDMHVRNILAKLGCRSRLEAVRKAKELGLLEPAG